MIVTITLNPSIDRSYMVNEFEKNRVFRCTDYTKTAGGKGLNVTRVINDLGEAVISTGFLGGRNGNFIQDELDALNIKNDFIKIKGETRDCIAILGGDNSQTEILESGPEISKYELNDFLKNYDNIIKESKIICASGSLPKNTNIDMYFNLIKTANKYNKKFILDTSGECLKEGIKAKPFLIKPNKEELENIISCKINNIEGFIKEAIKIQLSGVENVLISMGGDGSILVCSHGVLRTVIPKVNILNPVGSGDSMVAGFAVALERGYSIEKTLMFASACGTANAMEMRTGEVNIDNINSLIKQIQVIKL